MELTEFRFHFIIFIFMKVLIITGGSNGIGKAIAEKYQKEKFSVYSISRSAAKGASYNQIKVDLSKRVDAIEAINAVFSKIDLKGISCIGLINNAGTIGDIHTVGNLDLEKVENTIQLNTVIPLVLANEFIRITKNLNCKKQIINISSGAALKPYESWSAYCGSKSGLDMISKVIAEEQSKLVNGVKCVAIYPGVVDTTMQSIIRETPKENFSLRQRFIDLKEDSALYPPSFVAERIFQIDTEGLLQNGDIIDIRTF